METYKNIQKKTSETFNKFQKKYDSEMNCQKGCSRCCIDGISIFSWEAAIITDWYFNLSPEEKEKWIKNQSLPSSSHMPFVDNEGTDNVPCLFLRDDKCSIYDSRPSVCRTQGMSILLREDSHYFRDWCPLNFVDRKTQGFEDNENQTPEQKDDLNLETLNELLASAQIFYEKEMPESLGPRRVLLKDIWHYLIKA